MKNIEVTEKDGLQLVLNTFTEEQKEMVKQVNDLRKIILSLVEKMEGFEKKLEKLNVASSALDTAFIQSVVSKGVNEIKKALAELPKSDPQSKRFLLFPEHNAREYYSVVLRWILYIIIASYCYLLLKHMMDHWLV